MVPLSFKCDRFQFLFLGVAREKGVNSAGRSKEIAMISLILRGVGGDIVISLWNEPNLNRERILVTKGICNR